MSETEMMAVVRLPGLRSWEIMGAVQLPKLRSWDVLGSLDQSASCRRVDEAPPMRVWMRPILLYRPIQPIQIYYR